MSRTGDWAGKREPGAPGFKSQLPHMTAQVSHPQSLTFLICKTEKGVASCRAEGKGARGTPREDAQREAEQRRDSSRYQRQSPASVKGWAQPLSTSCPAGSILGSQASWTVCRFYQTCEVSLADDAGVVFRRGPLPVMFPKVSKLPT